MLDEKIPSIVLLSSKNNEHLLEYLASYRVLQAEPKEDTISFIENNAPSIVIIDNTETEEVNYRICREIKQNTGDRYLPIIMFTKTDRECIRAALKEDADDFITDKSDDLEILTRINSLLQIKTLYDKLAKERDQAQTYIDVAQTLIGVVDRDLKVVLANKKSSEVLGYPQEEIIGQKWFDVFLPERIRDMIKTGYNMVLEGEIEPPEFSEKPILTRTGEERLVFWHDVVLKDDQGGIMGTISSGEDITEKKQAEMALVEANKELQELDKMRNEFLANISKELQMPLASIKGFSNLLARGEYGEINSKQRDALLTITRNCDRLQKHVNVLLYASEDCSQNVIYYFEATDINSLLNKTLDELKINFAKYNLTLEINLEDIPQVNADETQLKNVIFQILDNAIKFTPANGKIKVSTSRTGKYVEMKIRDSGIGIAKDKVENIFKSFYQVDGSTRRKYGGTGIGLYICKKIVEGHKGKILVESVKGKGSEFTVQLPIRTQPDDYTTTENLAVAN
ncbi:ATP-binding response regulator [Methanohalophilus mahii]|uniref:histidine kinase n=1 Tax=Methanohalophilus mahii (strain ATCC 35705 / DSM 5219 / SLP) TaxID=547558 RepID=D5EAD3_METMS|nr:ATP-binding protein [Methanohalophilus mahii]ADE36134.1 multi-sensor signal transduction histidine kinase [Methanohalophilus mahii DSM 5219]